MRLEVRQSRFGAVAGCDLHATRGESSLDDFPNAFFIVNHKHGTTAKRFQSDGHCLRAREAISAVAGRVPGATGSKTQNAAPDSAEDCTSIVPPCSFTIARQIVSPKPGLPPGRFVVKNGSKIFPMSAEGIPGPSSAKVTRTLFPASEPETLKEPRSR